MTTIDTSISGAKFAANHQPFPMALVLDRAERRCIGVCGHRLGSPWAVETVFWASPQARPLGRSIGDGPPVSEPFRHPVPRPGWVTHQNAEVREQFSDRMDAWTRPSHTHRAMAGVDTPTPLGHTGYRPLRAATTARIWSGIYQYGPASPARVATDTRPFNRPGAWTCTR